MKRFFRKQLSAYGFTPRKQQFEVDEKLPEFVKTITLNQANWILREDDHYFKNYGLRVFDTDFLE
jgi:hypothetical protein